MQPQLKTLPEKKLIGKHIVMSMAQDKTHELWKNFMPRRKEINHNISDDLFSMRVYDPSYSFKNFNPLATFQKWAAIEVADFDIVPDDMETYIIPSGLYAVFYYKGSNTDTSIFQYIFGTWLPNSHYILDHRPHFEILGEKYKNNDENSEEEIWVPIRGKI